MEYWYITGTSNGLGKAIAEKVLQKKNTVVIGIARHQTIVHPNYLHFSFNLSDVHHAQAFQFAPHENAQKIVLLNNAGSLGEMKYAGELSNESITQTYHLNLISPHILSNNFIHSYKQHKAQKVIVNVSSGAASAVYDGWSVYAASKAALDRMTLCIAKELELTEAQCKIFSIAPGVMQTTMQETIRKTDKKNFTRKDKFVELHEQGKLYEPDVVAEKFIHIIDTANTQTEIIQRIQL